MADDAMRQRVWDLCRVPPWQALYQQAALLAPRWRLALAMMVSALVAYGAANGFRPMRYMTILLLAAVLAGVGTSPAAASAEDACLIIMKGSVRDTQNLYSEEETFNRYRALLTSANFKSYQDLASQSSNLGLNLQIAKEIIGFSKAAELDGGIFQREMDHFLQSTYDEVNRARASASNSYRINQERFRRRDSYRMNQELIHVRDQCQRSYFATLRDRVRLITLVEPLNYEIFVVRLDAYIPDDPTPDLIIHQIEPASMTTCAEKGRPVVPGQARGSQTALLTCTKDRNQTVSLVVRTNAGTSNAIVLPAESRSQP